MKLTLMFSAIFLLLLMIFSQERQICEGKRAKKHKRHKDSGEVYLLCSEEKHRNGAMDCHPTASSKNQNKKRTDKTNKKTKNKKAEKDKLEAANLLLSVMENLKDSDPQIKIAMEKVSEMMKNGNRDPNNEFTIIGTKLEKINEDEGSGIGSKRREKKKNKKQTKKSKTKIKIAELKDRLVEKRKEFDEQKDQRLLAGIPWVTLDQEANRNNTLKYVYIKNFNASTTPVLNKSHSAIQYNTYPTSESEGSGYLLSDDTEVPSIARSIKPSKNSNYNILRDIVYQLGSSTSHNNAILNDFISKTSLAIDATPSTSLLFISSSPLQSANSITPTLSLNSQAMYNLSSSQSMDHSSSSESMIHPSSSETVLQQIKSSVAPMSSPLAKSNISVVHEDTKDRVGEPVKNYNTLLKMLQDSIHERSVAALKEQVNEKLNSHLMDELLAQFYPEQSDAKGLVNKTQLDEIVSRKLDKDQGKSKESSNKADEKEDDKKNDRDEKNKEDKNEKVNKFDKSSDKQSKDREDSSTNSKQAPEMKLVFDKKAEEKIFENRPPLYHPPNVQRYSPMQPPPPAAYQYPPANPVQPSAYPQQNANPATQQYQSPIPPPNFYNPQAAVNPVAPNYYQQTPNMADPARGESYPLSYYTQQQPSNPQKDTWRNLPEDRLNGHSLDEPDAVSVTEKLRHDPRTGYHDSKGLASTSEDSRLSNATTTSDSLFAPETNIIQKMPQFLGKNFLVKFVLMRPFTKPLENTKTEAFRIFKLKTENAVNDLYKNDEEFKTSKVTSLGRQKKDGMTFVDMELYFKERSKSHLLSLQRQLINGVLGDKRTQPQMDISLLNDAITDINWCLPPCINPYECYPKCLEQCCGSPPHANQPPNPYTQPPRPNDARLSESTFTSQGTQQPKHDSRLSEPSVSDSRLTADRDARKPVMSQLERQTTDPALDDRVDTDSRVNDQLPSEGYKDPGNDYKMKDSYPKANNPPHELLLNSKEDPRNEYPKTKDERTGFRPVQKADSRLDDSLPGQYKDPRNDFLNQNYQEPAYRLNDPLVSPLKENVNAFYDSRNDRKEAPKIESASTNPVFDKNLEISKSSNLLEQNMNRIDSSNDARKNGEKPFDNLQREAIDKVHGSTDSTGQRTDNSISIQPKTFLNDSGKTSSTLINNQQPDAKSPTEGRPIFVVYKYIIPGEGESDSSLTYKLDAESGRLFCGPYCNRRVCVAECHKMCCPVA